MKEGFLNILQKLWLRKRSIPIMFLLAIGLFLSIATMFDSWTWIDVPTWVYILTAGALLGGAIAYSLACIFYDHLPRAPKGSLAVLFCIDAESEQLYEMAKFKLVDKFKLHVKADKSDIRAVCIAKKTIAKYDLQNPKDSISLLQKTNCVLIVHVRYSADDINNAENFELQINCSVSHPHFSEKVKAVISQDLRMMKGSVGKQRFSKSSAINVFSFTTQTLVCACQYILGFVYLLAGDNRHALNLLILAKKNIAVDRKDIAERRKLETLVDDRIFATLCQISVDYLSMFQREKDLLQLEEMEKTLEIANKIYPETYFYNMNMAYVHIALNKNASAAKVCIENCKKAKDNKTWVYSDAFLSAYCGHAPTTILTKYSRAFKVPYKSLVEVVDYIEFVIDAEPQKIALHLAAGLVYEAMGENKLMKHHLAWYLAHGAGINSKTRTLIEAKIGARDCGISCSQNCEKCAS